MVPPPARDPRIVHRLDLPPMGALRLPLALVLAFVVVAVTAWSTAANYVLVARDPAAPVDTYLRYLEGGSSRQVMAPLRVAGDPELHQILGNSAYRAAADRPVHHEVVDTRVSRDRARVDVEVALGDGSTVRRGYTVHRVTAWGPFNDSWQLRERDNATVAVRLPAAVDALSVNGQKVRPEEASTIGAEGAAPGSPERTWRFEGLPGRYDVALPEDSYLMASKHASALISLDAPRPASTRVTFTPSPRLWRAVDRAVQEAVGRCRNVLRFDAAECPLPRELEREASSSTGSSVSGGSAASGKLPPGVSTVQWELKARPALLLDQDAHDPLAFHAAQFRRAEATVTWLQNGQRLSHPVFFDIEATARTTGEHANVDVRLRPAQSHRTAGARPS
ncbi:hypothetical protein OH817_09605 [Kocuria rhizophila]|uniref:hypothetical protein n=1 Tax=Kocuria rhizophila TaxID=72000 RepID=UPI002ED5F031|nr:hypothetical protein OH817_09605 [Kocuria rhizophila]